MFFHSKGGFFAVIVIMMSMHLHYAWRFEWVFKSLLTKLRAQKTGFRPWNLCCLTEAPPFFLKWLSINWRFHWKVPARLMNNDYFFEKMCLHNVAASLLVLERCQENLLIFYEKLSRKYFILCKSPSCLAGEGSSSRCLCIGLTIP